ncbi:MAG: hypothetical protein HYS12_22310 [Planctomycetes bacterium]|nr:hypothetical protein [Planctomycetota bacterium]
MARSPRAADRNPLRRRLAALRRRLRFVVTVRGVGWLLTLLLFAAAGAGFLDWCWRLPALVRAVVLAGTLAGAGLVAYRLLLRPLADRADDLTLALRIEDRYPSLNDALASTVQFLEQAEKREKPAEGRPAMPVSPAMRLEAVRRALNKADGCDFNRVVDTRGLRTAGLSGLAACVLAATLLVLFPALAATALVRLADPFGSHDFPRVTILELGPHKSRIGRKDVFEVRGRVHGVIPEKAIIVYRQDNAPELKKEVPIVKDKDGRDTRDRGSGSFAAKFPPEQIQHNFSFQVVANDASTEWFRVEVAPAPTLTNLDGKPSPQVRLFYPSYTDLPPRSLPEGMANLDAPLGTIVTLRAAANVPLRKAWIEYQPAPDSSPGIVYSAAVAPTALTTGSVAAVALVQANGLQPAKLDADRRSFFVRFQPPVSGKFSLSLHFEDETGIANDRSYEMQINADPAPIVSLERPSPVKESLEVLPGAVLPLRAVAEDKVYALRSLWLEYRTRPDAPMQRLLLLSPGLAVRDLITGPLLWPGLPAAAALVKPQHAIIERPLEVASFSHADGSPLRAGDVLTLRVCADDYDDVTPHKAPGCSSEVEVRLITRAALEVAINRDEARGHKDLTELRQQQAEALKKVAEIENRVARTKKLTPDDLNELTRAEQTQQQIRERIDAPDQETVRSRVQRILETLKQNRVERSASQERMERVGNELDRLSREELQQIEERLSTARKQGEVPEESRQASRASEARQAEDVEKSAARAAEQANKLQELAEKTEDKTARARLEEESRRMQKQAERLREMGKGMRAEAKLSPQDAQAAARERAAELARLAEERERLAAELQKQATADSTGRDRDLRKLAQDVKDGVRPLRQQAAQQADAGRSAERNEVKAGLTEARRRQEEVEKTLGDLLQNLERWSSTREVKGESRAILEEQRRLNDEVEAMKRAGLGARLEELKPEQRARLDNVTGAQERLRERMQQLMQKMNRLAEDRKESDPETAREMREAFEQASQPGITSPMKDAEDQLKSNQLNNASGKQQEAIGELEKFVKRMEDRRAAELDQQIERLRKKEGKLEELTKRQAELKRKVRDAQKIKDPKQREQELKRLAREQQKLQEEAQELAKELSRLRAERSSQSLQQAAKQMEEAVRRLERGEAPEEKQEEALDRLDEAMDDLEKSRGANEAELAREQLTRVADVLKRLKERQDGQVKESARIQKEVLEHQEWTRGLRISLADMARAQEGLAHESRDLAAKELVSAPVFARLMRRAADSMLEAAQQFDERAKRTMEHDKNLSSLEGDPAQKRAQQRLQQLLDALKMEEGANMRPASGKGEGEGSGRELGDNIPPLAQLKLLRAMQAEVNERTKDFAKKHPDTSKLTEPQKKELQTIQREQREVAELVEDYSGQSAPNDGDKE